jgi:hypothetical protein
MKIATSWSTTAATDEAVKAAYERLVEQLGAEPHLIVLHCSVAYDCEQVVKLMGELAPAVPLHGSTSCLGVMTEAGLHAEDGRGMGMLGVLDPAGS